MAPVLCIAARAVAPRRRVNLVALAEVPLTAAPRSLRPFSVLVSLSPWSLSAVTVDRSGL